MHLNPIRPRRFKNANAQSKSDYLKNYPWSSYPGYCYLRKSVKIAGYCYLRKSVKIAKLGSDHGERLTIKDVC